MLTYAYLRRVYRNHGLWTTKQPKMHSNVFFTQTWFFGAQLCFYIHMPRCDHCHDHAICNLVCRYASSAPQPARWCRSSAHWKDAQGERDAVASACRGSWSKHDLKPLSRNSYRLMLDGSKKRVTINKRLLTITSHRSDQDIATQLFQDSTLMHFDSIVMQLLECW